MEGVGDVTDGSGAAIDPEWVVEPNPTPVSSVRADGRSSRRHCVGPRTCSADAT